MPGLRGFRRACAVAGVATATVIALAVALPPMQLRRVELQQALSRSLGVPLEIGDVVWQLLPWPELRLLNAEARARLLERLPLEIRVERAEVGASGPFDLVPSGGPPGRVRLVGLELHAGPLVLRDGTLELEREGPVLAVRGRALGAYGGWLDVSGALAEGPLPAPPVRVYAANLDLPVPMPTAFDAPAADARLRVSGVVSLSRAGQEGDELEVDLHLRGLRPDGGGEWLDLTVRGRLARHAGVLLPGTELAFDGWVRDLAGVAEPRAVHGPVRGRLVVSGALDALHVRADVDVSGLRIRYGEWFDKLAGVAARAVLRGRLGPDGLDRARVDLRLGDLRARLERGGDGEWRLHSGVRPVGAWLGHAPALRRALAGLSARARVRATRRPGDDPRGLLELREVALARRDARLTAEAASVQVAPGEGRLEARGLAIGGQRADLSGEARWAADQPLHAAFTLSAGELRIEPLCDAIAPLLATGPPPPRGEEPWRTAVGGVVKLLREDPGLLPRLRLEPGRLRFERLVGLGLDSRDAEIVLTIRDQTLRITHRDAASERRYRVDLGGWMPRVARKP
jgi:hypothetical protein